MDHVLKTLSRLLNINEFIPDRYNRALLSTAVFLRSYELLTHGCIGQQATCREDGTSPFNTLRRGTFKKKKI